MISLANGELQGYIVTSQAVGQGSYESSNALFSHKSGEILVDKTLIAVDFYAMGILLLWVAMILGLISGIQYFKLFWQTIDMTE